MRSMNSMRDLWNRAIHDRVQYLVLAAVIIGVAISIDGDARRIVNGIGGIVWLIAGYLIVTRAVSAGVSVKQVFQVAFVILILSYLIRPTDPLWAVIGFGWGGVIVGFNGQNLGSKMGAMLGALWLPAHLLLAVIRAVVRNVSDEPPALRSDPPPTAAVVPLIMVVAAWLFAALAADWRNSRDEAQPGVPRRPFRSGQPRP